MKKIHYIAHTHWDKEWYKTYEEFRVKFLIYFENILETLESDKEFKCFMFDAQSSIIDDYLQIKPHNQNRLKKLIEQKKLLLGPWYTLPDNYLSSSESIVRNLLIGKNMANEYGYSQNVCYIPDSFGQNGNMVQVAKNFNFDAIVLWRGVDKTQTESSIFMWKGIDDSEMLSVHLPLGYGYSKKLPKTEEEASEYMKSIIEMLEKKYRSKNILHMGGSDHEPIQKELPNLIESLNQNLKDKQIVISSLDNYIKDIKKEVIEKDLEILSGELRSTRDQRLHYGDASGRVDIKQKNRRMEFLISEVLEPILSIAKIKYGFKYDNDIVNYIWKQIFANQAHDSACTTCIDEAHDDIETRYRKVEEVSVELIKQVNKFLIEGIKIPKGTSPIVYWNTLPFTCNEKFIELEIDSDYRNFEIIDINNRKIDFILKNQIKLDKVQENVEYCNYISMVSAANDFIEKNKGEEFTGFTKEFYKNRIFINQNIIKPMSCGILFARESTKDNKKVNHLNVNKNIFENDYAKYEFNKNGTLNIFDKVTKAEYKNLGLISSVGEDGDSYDYSPPKNDKDVTSINSIANISMVNISDQHTTFLVKNTFDIPQSLSPTRNERSEKTEKLNYEQEFTVYKYKKDVDLKMRVSNKSTEHLLTIEFPFNNETKTNYSGNWFGTIKRENNLQIPTNWKQTHRSLPYALYPFQRNVILCDEKSAFAISTFDSSEYQIIDNKKIRISLLRAFKYMGKPNLEFRPGRPSGIFWKTPKSNMYMDLEYKLNINWESGDNTFESINNTTSSFLNQVNTFEVIQDIFFEKNERFEIDFKSIFELNNKKKTIVLSAFKKCEKNESYIIRLYNSSPIKNSDIELTFDSNIKQVYLSDLNESKLDKINLVDHKLIIKNVLPNKFVTLILEVSDKG